MPTILRFRGFQIAIYFNDHPPAHVHVAGADGMAVYILHCPGGPVTLRGNEGLGNADLRAIEKFLNDNLNKLCERWAEIDAQRPGNRRSQ